MDANLVGSPGFQAAFDQAVFAESFESANMRHRALTDLRVSRAAAPAIAPIPRDMCQDRAVARCSVDDGPVDTMDFVTAELIDQIARLIRKVRA